MSDVVDRAHQERQTKALENIAKQLKDILTALNEANRIRGRGR